MQTPNNSGKWYYEPWAVILLILLVLGPFGLPLVFKSPKFSRTAKWVVTVLTLLYTVYLIYATVDLTRKMVQFTNQFLAAFPAAN